MKEPKVFLLCDLKDNHPGSRTKGGLRKLSGEKRVLAYPMSCKTKRHNVENLKRRNMPVVLVHDHMYAEDHPRRNVNRVPLAEFPESRHDEPMRVRVHGKELVTLEMTKDLGVDYVVDARTVTSIAAYNNKPRIPGYTVRDARNGRLKRKSRNFDDLKDMREDLVRTMLEMNLE